MCEVSRREVIEAVDWQWQQDALTIRCILRYITERYWRSFRTVFGKKMDFKSLPYNFNYYLVSDSRATQYSTYIAGQRQRNKRLNLVYFYSLPHHKQTINSLFC